MRPDVPAYHLDVDREKAKSLGLTLSDVFQTLQAMLSTYYVNDFNLFGKTYRVQVEAKPQFRTGPQDIGKLYVRNESGAMVPVSAFSQGRMQGGPALVTRFNGFTAAQVNGEPPPGKSSGEMLAAAERLGIEFAATRARHGLRRPVAPGEARQRLHGDDLRPRHRAGLPDPGRAV